MSGSKGLKLVYLDGRPGFESGPGDSTHAAWEPA